MFYKKVFLETRKIHKKTHVPMFFLIRLQAQACNFTKKEAPAQVFHLNFTKFLRTSFLTEHVQYLFLIDARLLASCNTHLFIRNSAIHFRLKSLRLN